jgi:hypothetical protein
MTSYTVERFLSSCQPKLAKSLKALWAEGGQLAAAKVPESAIVPVIIIAAYGKKQDIELVDDYDALLEAFRELTKGGACFQHPDTFFASSICIMAARGQDVSLGGFESIGVPDIYEELFGEE